MDVNYETGQLCPAQSSSNEGENVLFDQL